MIFFQRRLGGLVLAWACGWGGGGLVLGLVESFWSAYADAAYKDVAAYGILVLVLIFRPTGLLGRAETEKV